MEFPSLRIGDLIARIPIVQGGMGVGISLSNLASAVMKEGGIGVIAAAMIGMGEPDIGSNYREANVRALTREIRAARQKADGILGVNIMVALTNFSDMVRTSIKEGVDVIFAGAGLPLDLPSYLEGAKTKLVPIVSSARAAAIICKKWLQKFDRLPDAFVVEGPKAGGHLGFKPEQIQDPAFALERIVPEVVATVREFEERAQRPIPVIAAGGVYEGADIHKFLELGAAGVQMGTRFVATHECDADPRFKEAYIQAKPEDIEIIQSPVGLPGRAIISSFLEDVKRGLKKPFTCPFHCVSTCDYTKSPYCIGMALTNAKKGLLKHGFAFAGANAWRVDKIISVRELIDSLRQGFAAAVADSSPEPCVA
ncbi:MAG: nitronate monooxygenase [Desulfomicrobiaceae bacterium]